MFTKSELLAGWRALTGGLSPPLEVVKFVGDDFTSPSSEQSVTAVRGARADFSSGLLFWVKAMEVMGCGTPEQPYLDDWPLRRYVDLAPCEPIGPAEFARVVDEHSGCLRFPLPKFVLDLAGRRSGLRMYAEWNEVMVVAEPADSFVLFEWFTTA